MLRPGNAGANNAFDHEILLDQAISQLPEQWRGGHWPGDDADLVNACAERNIEVSVGMAIDLRVREALLLAEEEDWMPATRDGRPDLRRCLVTELTELIDLSARGEGARLICRRERPHLGAQLSLFDTLEGYRHQCFLTTSAGEIAERELRHRARRVETASCRQGHGLRNLSFRCLQRGPGSSSCSPPWTSSPGPKPCAGNESYAVPRPRLDELELAARLQRSQQLGSAIEVLDILTRSDDPTDRRHAWRVLATIAYESGRWDEADAAFEMALQNAVGMKKGGKLSVAIHRYARLLTEEEEYGRALAIVSRAPRVTIASGWLWRRYVCIKWYAGELLGATLRSPRPSTSGTRSLGVLHARGKC